MATPTDPEGRRMWALSASAGSTLTGPVLLGVGIDLMAGTMPWFTLGGVFLGMAGLTVILLRLSRPR